MIVEATTPTRIDLSGGTLDLYPLYLFLDGGVTNNAAIDLLSKVRIEPRDDRQVHLRSVDTDAELVAPSIEELPVDRELSLVARVVRFYRPKTGVNVITDNTPPHGSGLGASSSLLIALSGALDRINGTNMDPYLFVEYGANVEAQAIAIPTGKQDYLAALYGGVNAFRFDVKGWGREPLIVEEDKLRAFEERIVLTFTGETHFSGTNNWNMMKRFIDDQPGSRESMRTIQRMAGEMREALLAFDVERFAELLDREWESRKRLAEGVTTPAIDRMVEAAKEAGALASKICGAGGGGCMITFVEEGKREAVETALESVGAQVMPFRIAREGLTIKEV
ncbi:MAG: GHMP kinase [Armatimonadota bacterium]|nr:MAG: GHMP kinase [Armatimonadota bacterium]